MGDEEAAPAPVAPVEYKLRTIGGEGAPASLDDVDPTVDVVLSAGGSQYVVARAAAETIPLVSAVLEKFDTEKGAAKEEEHLGQVTEIPLPVVKPEVAAAILEYIERHTAAEEEDKPRVEKPLRGKIEDVCPKWALDFVNRELVKDGDEKQHAKLFDVLVGAHALGARSLEDLCGLAAASVLKGKSPEQMRELFSITGDFLPEEEEKISEDTKWTRQ
jgi:S-phase kinase-associated protein 1